MCWNVQRAITQKKQQQKKKTICPKVDKFIYSSLLISWLGFKSLAQILFEISYCQTRFHYDFPQRDITSKRETTRTRKNMGKLIFDDESIYDILNFVSCMIPKIWHAWWTGAHGWTNQKQYEPLNFFEVGGIISVSRLYSLQSYFPSHYDLPQVAEQNVSEGAHS